MLLLQLLAAEQDVVRIQCLSDEHSIERHLLALREFFVWLTILPPQFHPDVLRTSFRTTVAAF